MNNIVKFFQAFIVIFILIFLFSNVFAATNETVLNIVQSSSETKYLENDQGFISKSIVDSNPEKGEVTVELKLSNTKKDIDLNGKTEVFLVIDNSPSMDFVTASGRTRKEIVIDSTKVLVNSIFDNVSNVDVGVIKFSGYKSGGLFDFDTPADINNATLVKALTNNKDDILEGIQEIADASTFSGTNIDAGLQRAEQNFSDSCQNKVIVLLTDGVPNADVKGNSSGNDTTSDTSLIIQQNTKETLQRLDNSGISIISMMTGMSESDGNTDKNGNVYETSSLEDDLAAVERVFGTETNPTAGKYYLVASANVSTIIENDIFKDVLEKIQNPINTVKMIDYFPEDITDNFEFEYVGTPNIGTVSDKIDSETNTISWDIDTLKGDEVATLKYKLKIKDMKNETLLNKTISTNQKVVLTYKDSVSQDYTVTLDSSPKIKLQEKEQSSTRKQ